MTLDEAIKHCEEKAKEIRKANEEMPTDCKLSEDLCECAKEHEQLAEWLKQLKYLQSSSSYAELTALRKFKAENERPQGEWINQEQGAFYPIECSKCHNQPFCNDKGYVLSNFCPNCGAKMKGGAE